MRPLTAALIIGVVLAGLNAGFFFTWSFSVMNGLDAASADVAVRAMQAMNENVRNGPFAVVFFGAPAWVLVCLISGLMTRQWSCAVLTLIGLAGLLATVVITATVHLPANEALAMVDIQALSAADMQSQWTDYAEPWTDLNTVRFGTSLLGFIFLILAAIRPGVIPRG